MHKLFYLIGKSSSGKDTIFQRLLQDGELNLRPLVLYTTRPMRAGEEPDVQYHFTDQAGLERLQKAGKVIEIRTYETIQGPWSYFTADSGIDLEKNAYLGIGVLESCLALRNYYGEDRVVPLYIEVEDGKRLQRALDRERAQQKPQYAELCRRFLADSEDFSEDKLTAAGIHRRFQNDSLEACLEEIRDYMIENE